MNSFIHTLSDTVLSKSFESCSLEELKTLSQAHPYASAIQLLYARKLKQSGSTSYNEQLQQTLLHYSNPLFIRQLVINNEDKIALVPHPIVVETIEEQVAALQETTDLPDLTEDMVQPVQVATAPVVVNGQENDAREEPHQDETPQSAAIQADNEEDGETEQEFLDGDATLPPLPEFKFEPIDAAKAELAFMPYHTVDYFAAQGIKLSDDSATGDRFGTQLKSFTAWLKQMKRLPGAGAKGNITVTEEKSIEQMAEQSIQGENADTEAMAQVWAKQGNAKKAIEIYKKLSLQIPAKSAYFAAKIDHLKK